MKSFNGFDDAKKAAASMGSGEKLPVGAYVCQIKKVQYVPGENGYSDRIDLLFDICEGEQMNFLDACGAVGRYAQMDIGGGK